MVGTGRCQFVIQSLTVYGRLLKIPEGNQFQEYSQFHQVVGCLRLEREHVVVTILDGVGFTLVQQSIDHLPLLAAYYPLLQWLYAYKALEVLSTPCWRRVVVEPLSQCHFGGYALAQLHIHDVNDAFILNRVHIVLQYHIDHHSLYFLLLRLAGRHLDVSEQGVFAFCPRQTHVH